MYQHRPNLKEFLVDMMAVKLLSGGPEIPFYYWQYYKNICDEWFTLEEQLAMNQRIWKVYYAWRVHIDN